MIKLIYMLQVSIPCQIAIILKMTPNMFIMNTIYRYFGKYSLSRSMVFPKLSLIASVIRSLQYEIGESYLKGKKRIFLGEHYFS